MIMANHVKYEGPLNFLMAFIKNLKVDLNAQNLNGKQIFYENIEKLPLFCYFLPFFP